MHLNFTMIFGYNWRHLVFPHDSPSPPFSQCIIVISLCLSVFPSLKICIYICPSLCPSQLLYPSVPFPRFFCPSVSLCLLLFVHLCFSLSVCVYIINPYVSTSLYLSLNISVFNSAEHLHHYKQGILKGEISLYS